MANRRAYDIAFVGLKPGVHEFNYELEEKFFTEKSFPYTPFPKASVKLQLEKNSGFMLLHFHVGGQAEVLCDRCGNPITIDLWDEFKMMVKLVDNPEEMNEQEEDPDVFYISKTESHLSVGDWLYEFVLLSLPTQQICGTDETGKSLCNQEVVEKLKQMTANQQEHNAGSIWKGLDQFKNNNN